MTREHDPFRIPRAGWEAAPLAGLASLDLNQNGGAFSGREFLSESTVGGVALYAAYQALLTALRTEALRRRGEIDRLTQVRLVLRTSFESAKTGVAVGAVLSVVLLVFPWLAAPPSPGRRSPPGRSSARSGAGSRRSPLRAGPARGPSAMFHVKPSPGDRREARGAAADS